MPIRSCHIRKETLARERGQQSGITSGLIGVWSCVEAATTFRATFDRLSGYLQLRLDSTRCKHRCFYYDHSLYCFMSVRLQTWFPFEMQIAINGREWLRRSLDAAGCAYLKRGNKFLGLPIIHWHSSCFSAQLDTRWKEMFDTFLPEVFPTRVRNRLVPPGLTKVKEG